ncbi:MAG: nicotinate-nucleotide--dimethylbenzimidazole phosphoribosyltransferase [Gemmatimonadota bacterium]
MSDVIRELTRRIAPPSGAMPDAVQRHLDDLTKPPGSLGRLENIAVRLATIVGDPPAKLARRTVFVLAADHGVTARGVSAYPAEVTAQMCLNLAGGGAAVCAFARTVGCDVVVADLGVRYDGPLGGGVLHHRVAHGSADLVDGPALTAEERDAAVAAGAALVEAVETDVVCLGEMGIGNSTSAAALTALLTDGPPEDVVGPGTGVEGNALEAKRAVVRTATERVGPGRPAEEVLAEVGGLEIAGLVGVILAATGKGLPVIVDGFISTAAALVAVGVEATVRDYLFAGHRSAEPGHDRALAHLGLHPVLDLNFRLGEGTGAVLALPVIDAAGAMLRDMATFSGAGVSGRTDGTA